MSEISKEKVKEAIIRANSKKDYVVLGICLVIIVLILGVVAFIGLVAALDVPDWAVESSLGGYVNSLFSTVIFLLFALVAILVITRMMRQSFLGNALQIEYSDYAWLRKWSNQIARDFDMPKVEIMVTQDPYMNAFAFGFMKPYTIVLHSGSIRYLDDEQLKAIVVHEMAHVRYHHTQIATYLGALRVIPVLGGGLGWIIDFWSRRTELTSDRLALFYLRDPELVKMALIRVHVGPDVAESFNDIARKWQVYMTDSAFNRFTQTFSAHPFLVRRLQHIDEMAKLHGGNDWKSHSASEVVQGNILDSEKAKDS
jgi:Zn-dependent protease with chaperone function